MTAPTPDIKLAEGFPAPGYDHWRGMVEKALKGADFDKRLVTRTADGITVKPLYARTDALVSAEGAMPGAAPFTRGTKPIREGFGWDIRSFVSETDAKVANTAILEDLEGGVNSISLHVGPTSLSPTSEALDAALKDVMLDVCPISFVADEHAFDAARGLAAVWKSRNIATADRKAHFDADPLGTLAIAGQLGESIDSALARAVALINVTQESQAVTALTANGFCYHNAGATEAQELACIVATVVAYLRAAEAGGIGAAKTLPKITVGLAADTDEFATIAKFRAARQIVWRVADACGAGGSAAQVKYSAVTSYRMMAKRDCWTNILRTTIACTGAALGGADSICVLPFTFALGKTDRFARRVARNIQVVCQEESSLGRVTDPAGGSWYVEQLTSDMAKKAWEIFQDIEARGGMVSCLTSGFIQETIEKSAEARAKLIATGRYELTGVSAFPLLGDDGIKAEPWPMPDKAASKSAAVSVTPLKEHRLGEAFEELRDAADAAGGFKIFLASMGEIAEHNVRTTWVKNYLASGGIETLISDGYDSAAVAAAAFNNSGTTVACICSSDAVYATHAEITARALKAKGATWVMMAGRPGDKEAALRAAGVDQFLFAGADAVATLKGLQERLG